jgi:hypothetical protein
LRSEGEETVLPGIDSKLKKYMLEDAQLGIISWL